MLTYVTTNEGKLREAREYLDDVRGFDYDYVEVQADDLETVAARGARDAYRAAGGDPVVVDDSGLFVDALDGFPGPYSSYVEDTLGVERVWRLAAAESDRGAAFRCVVGYAEGDGEVPTRVETFAGSVRGTLVAPRGDGGFGYDPIFEHDGTTFAEMDAAEKNALSHRGRALAAFAEWYETRDD